ncbi:alpha/beta fold hydrolase [Rudaeicoccus suwonensis]|uniref:3-oxoadipate enol-lactonase n=1 Tax=Rudaeicoccus suwonensis TaxID=657409 RepID=A0A561E838_9MICO|nr:alpha/beta fold hydrolase [Rudaeicoccus suwonensis]TWE11767.1 3-oxoadipate enol-lactonase [Rudaeicoccus suwonensis]
MHYVRTGPRSGCPALLLHSAGLDLTYWDAQFAALSTERDVIAVDLPGHGRSAGAAEDIEIGRIRSVVAAFIRDLDIGQVDLIGLSVGGLIAQAVAVEHSPLVRSLSLLDTAAKFSTSAQTAMHERADRVRDAGMVAILDELFEHWFLPTTRAARPDLIDRATKTLLHDDPSAHAALWDMIANFDAADRLAEIAVPTLVLVGEHDSSSPIASARMLHDGIARAELQVLPDAAHLAPIETPRTVNNHLRAFLGSRDLDGGR